MPYSLPSLELPEDDHNLWLHHVGTVNELDMKAFLQVSTFGVISDFRHEVDKICALLGYYAAYNGNSLPIFLANLSVPKCQ